jgi:hypothetical protein
LAKALKSPARTPAVPKLAEGETPLSKIDLGGSSDAQEGKAPLRSLFGGTSRTAVAGLHEPDEPETHSSVEPPPSRRASVKPPKAGDDVIRPVSDALTAMGIMNPMLAALPQRLLPGASTDGELTI